MLIRLKDQYDEKSWEEFVATYRQYIYNVIRRMELNHHDALEIVQLVLIKLWKKLPDFSYDNYRGKFRNWLYTVTANQVRDFLRGKNLSLSKIPDSSKDLEKSISIPEIEDTSIAWCHTTSPLFNNYKEAVEKYKSVTKKGTHNGLTTVSTLGEFIISEKARPVNYHWGVWHEYSQNLDKLFSITGGLFIAKKSEMLKNRYVCSTKPYLFKVSDYEAIDIDNIYDFRIAQLMYENKSKLENL